MFRPANLRVSARRDPPEDSPSTRSAVPSPSTRWEPVSRPLLQVHQPEIRPLLRTALLPRGTAPRRSRDGAARPTLVTDNREAMPRRLAMARKVVPGTALLRVHRVTEANRVGTALRQEHRATVPSRGTARRAMPNRARR